MIRTSGWPTSSSFKLLSRIGASAVGSAAQALMLLAVAKGLGAVNYGHVAQLISLGYFTGGLLSLGMSARALRARQGVLPESLWSTLLVARGALALIIAASIGGLGVVTHVGVFGCVAAAVFIFNELCLELLQSVYAGAGRQLTGSILLVVQRCLACGLTLALAGEGQLEGFIAGQATTLGLVIISAVPWVRQRWMAPRLVVKGASGFWYAALTANVYQLDINVAGFVGGSSIAGVMSAGSRLNGPLNIITAAMLNVFLPELASATPSKRRSIEQRIKRFGIIYALILVCLAPVGSLALVSFLGPSYETGSFYYGSLFVAAGLSGLSQVFQALVFAAGRPAIAGHAILLGGICGLGALALGVALAGVEGAAAGPVSANLIILLVLVMRYRKVLWAPEG